MVLQEFFTIKPIDTLKSLLQIKNQPADSSTPQPSWPLAEKQLNIFIRDQKFLPNASAVKTNTKITWFNEDTKIHNVTGDTWASGDLAPGQSYTKIFDTPGNYKYRCSIHPSMAGEIVVK